MGWVGRDWHVNFQAEDVAFAFGKAVTAGYFK